jgi:hypothetical protein
MVSSTRLCPTAKLGSLIGVNIRYYYPHLETNYIML